MPTGKRSVNKGKEPPPQPSPPPGKKGKKGASKDKPATNHWQYAVWFGIIGGLLFYANYRGRQHGDGTAAKPRSPPQAARGEISTMRFLELAMRLQEMTEIASSLETTGMLDSDSAAKLDEELKGIEAELGDEATQGTVARDLRSMVSVVRGTLYQRGNKLTDEEVEASGSAFTYANPRYWDDYYNKTTSDEKFDWYGSWDTPITEMTFDPTGAGELKRAATLGDVLRPFLAPEQRILMFGCGNSDMSEKMYVDGLEHIVNIDISPKLLDGLRERLGASMPKMRWQYENASALTFGDGEFDVTIDKGTLDAIEQNKPLLYAAAREAHRTLRPGGYFLSVTFNSAPLRVDGQLREGADWGECHTHEFERPDKKRDSDRSVYFLHACQKQPL